MHLDIDILLIKVLSINSCNVSMDCDTQPERQPSYLVFESALMQLFTKCTFCLSDEMFVKKKIVGSFISISQKCSQCDYERTWNSQPFISTHPAGNILSAAAILYSGAFPTKVLRLFQILKCAMISSSTFYRYQKLYLQPAVNNFWMKHQRMLFAKLKQEKKPLVLAGDGRADSPGHSAKYGTYTVIELGCNKVLDFKIVQVSAV